MKSVDKHNFDEGHCSNCLFKQEAVDLFTRMVMKKINQEHPELRQYIRPQYFASVWSEIFEESLMERIIDRFTDFLQGEHPQ